MEVSAKSKPRPIPCLTRRLVALSCVVFCIFVTASPMPAYGFDVVPVVPADSVVMEAPQEVAPTQARFLGRWEGPLIGHKGQIPHTLVVERVNRRNATVVWSSGDTQYTSAHVRRLDGTFKGDDELVLYTLGSPMSYRMHSDGTLVATYIYFADIELRGAMRKVAGPTVPYAAQDEKTNWPANISTIGYERETTSPIPAELPAKLAFKQTSNFARAKWIGSWGGAPCTNAACSAKLAVVRIEGEEVQAIAMWASKDGLLANGIYRAKFVDEELRIVTPLGQRLTYRMRDENSLEVYRLGTDGRPQWGVLVRE